MDDYHQRLLDKFCAFSVSDTRGTISEINGMFCQYFGYEEHELIGQTYAMLKSGYHSPEFFTDLWAVISKGEVWKGDICNRTKAGKQFWVNTTIVPELGPAGEVIRHLTYQISVNPPKQPEKETADSGELYHSLVNNLPLSVWRKDREGKITYVNKALVKQIKLEESELLGKTSHDLYPKELADKYELDDQEVMSKGIPLHSIEENMDLTTGEPQFFETIKIPIRGANGKIEGLQGVFWNITDSIETQKKLEAQNEQLTEIAWLHSHKIRGPVATIMGLMNIFDWDNIASPQNIEIVKNVDQVSQQLDSIIHDVVKKTGDLYKNDS